MKSAAAAVVLSVAAVALIQADTTTIQVVTSVTDRQGHAVAGLKAKDFSILENGAGAKVIAVEPRQAGPRTLAIVLDEFHVDAADALLVRQAAAHFVRDDLRPEDLVAVIKPLDPLNRIHFTTDHASLLAAIAAFDGRKGNYEPRNQLEEETLGRAPALVESGRAQVVLSALRALAAQLTHGSEHAAVLLISNGFQPGSRRMISRGLPDEAIVERSANRYDVPVYLFDPRPADATAANALASLAADTGATTSYGPDLLAALTAAARDLDAGYVLTFEPSHADDGRFHPIAVSVTLARNAAATVRTRAGYVSPPSEEMRRAMRADPDPAFSRRALRRSPLIAVWSGITRATPTNSHVVVAWQPQSTAAGLLNTPAVVALKATTRDGRLLFEGMLSPAKGGNVSTGSAARAEFDAPVGEVLLDMTILGGGGQKLDVDARDLAIVAPKAGAPLLLPPMIIVSDSAREYRDALGDAEATPDPSREFRRTERLLIRVPAYSVGTPVQLTVRLLNRAGEVMRPLTPIGNSNGLAQYDLSLAALAPGDYYLEVLAVTGNTTATQRISFHVSG